MTPRELALQDCKYALSLSETALDQHLDIWLNCPAVYIEAFDEEDEQYLLTLQEIKASLYTDECLITKEK